MYHYDENRTKMQGWLSALRRAEASAQMRAFFKRTLMGRRRFGASRCDRAKCPGTCTK